jgi:O-antigen biosynthesis protein WbqP
MNRKFEILLSILLIIIVAIPMLIIAVAVAFSSSGPVIHFSRRFGKEGNIFIMPKFRTMYQNTPDVATELLPNPEKYITKLGKFLRLYSLDELPQLFSVLKGDMSLVGPRPALHNQDDLMELRKSNGTWVLRPGITGLAQINGRDNLTIDEKAELDLVYMRLRSGAFDIKILSRTVLKVLNKANVAH